MRDTRSWIWLITDIAWMFDIFLEIVARAHLNSIRTPSLFLIHFLAKRTRKKIQRQTNIIGTHALFIRQRIATKLLLLNEIRYKSPFCDVLHILL